MFPVTKWVKSVVGMFSLDDAYYYEEVVDVSPDGVFTQSELSQLKLVLSENIFLAEKSLDDAKSSLLIYLNADKDTPEVEFSKKFYRKEITRLKKRIKLLANLSYKVKHKIIFVNNERT